MRRWLPRQAIGRESCLGPVVLQAMETQLAVSCGPAINVLRLVMKSLTVRLPETMVADIEAESRGRNISKSDVVRERLERAPRRRRRAASLHAIADLIGSVSGLPTDLASHKKKYLQATGYGRRSG
jgi:Arc/MetJ-type ribon-helix-helix transcriptional regulator